MIAYRTEKKIHYNDYNLQRFDGIAVIGRLLLIHALFCIFLYLLKTWASIFIAF